VVYRKGFKLRGIATSNQAEYTALIYTLDFILSRGLKGVLVQGDSLLVINQLNGVFQCRSENLIRYYNTAKKLILRIQTQLGTTPVFEHIPRERNDEADRECQEAHKVG
jgi:ribonuclease HI